MLRLQLKLFFSGKGTSIISVNIKCVYKVARLIFLQLELFSDLIIFHNTAEKYFSGSGSGSAPSEASFSGFFVVLSSHCPIL